MLIVTLGYGLIGFADDYLKLTKRSSGGLSGRLKLLGQGGIGLIAAVVLVDLGTAAAGHRRRGAGVQGCC